MGRESRGSGSGGWFMGEVGVSRCWRKGIWCGLGLIPVSGVPGADLGILGSWMDWAWVKNGEGG